MTKSVMLPDAEAMELYTYLVMNNISCYFTVEKSPNFTVYYDDSANSTVERMVKKWMMRQTRGVKMPRKKKCPWKDKCQNGGDGCYAREPESCVRFMPIEGTNLTKIDGVVETPPGIDYDKFSQYFTNWIESMGWAFCGSMRSGEEKE